MPGQVYTERIFGPAYLSSVSSYVLMTVPAGHIYIVRALVLCNSSGTLAVLARVGLGPVGFLGGKFYSRTLAVNETDYRECRIPLYPGEELVGQAGTINVVAVTVTAFDFLA